MADTPVLSPHPVRQGLRGILDRMQLGRFRAKVDDVLITRYSVPVGHLEAEMRGDHFNLIEAVWRTGFNVEQTAYLLARAFHHQDPERRFRVVAPPPGLWPSGGPALFQGATVNPAS